MVDRWCARLSGSEVGLCDVPSVLGIFCRLLKVGQSLSLGPAQRFLEERLALPIEQALADQVNQSMLCRSVRTYLRSANHTKRNVFRGLLDKELQDIGNRPKDQSAARALTEVDPATDSRGSLAALQKATRFLELWQTPVFGKVSDPTSTFTIGWDIAGLGAEISGEVRNRFGQLPVFQAPLVLSPVGSDPVTPWRAVVSITRSTRNQLQDTYFMDPLQRQGHLWNDDDSDDYSAPVAMGCKGPDDVYEVRYVDLRGKIDRAIQFSRGGVQVKQTVGTTGQITRRVKGDPVLRIKGFAVVARAEGFKAEIPEDAGQNSKRRRVPGDVRKDEEMPRWRKSLKRSLKRSSNRTARFLLRRLVERSLRPKPFRSKSTCSSQDGVKTGQSCQENGGQGNGGQGEDTC